MLDLAGTVAVSLLIGSADLEAPAKRYAAAAVLHADAEGLGPRTRAALDRAADLYRIREVKAILCIGGNRPRRERQAGDAMRDYLVSAGVPAAGIVVDRSSYDTRSNLQSAAALLRSHGWGSVILVVQPLHRPRVEYHARRAMPEVDFIALRPRAQPPGLMPYLATWSALHHELVAWALTLCLSAEMLDGLVRALRALPSAEERSGPIGVRPVAAGRATRARLVFPSV